ncbi:hypothetical protein TWF696_000249 [Orbilia brochopaga]|uniref:Uncharacterized protein n=1 Tax=Orbilia brochopaga TaxID=3140254 RepID=A0AAV9VD69_9PEZI
MSLFSTLTTFAASTLVDSYKQAQPRPAPQQVTVEEIDEPTPPPLPSRRLPQIEFSFTAPAPAAPRIAMQPVGLPQNSIWTTMSYPIPRGPCLQKSSLISACSCQRFMVHPLKATSSFDCDGCGHHASFHRMKSHEEEVEQAARARDSASETQSRDARDARVRALMVMPPPPMETDGEDDETLDGEEDEDVAGRPARKRLAVNRAGSEASESSARRGGTGRRGGAASSTRTGKRKRTEAVVLE